MGGRACHYWVHYCLLHNYVISNKKWPLPVGAIGDSVDHMVKWMYLWPKNFDLLGYLKLYVSDPNRLSDIEAYITEHTEGAISEINKSPLKSLNDSELASLITFVFQEFHKSSYIAAVLRMVDVSIQYYFNTVLSVDKNKADIIRYSGIPKVQSYSMREEVELLSLASSVFNKEISDSEKNKQIEFIRDNYCWSVCGYYNEKPKSIEEYVISLNGMISSDPQIRLKEIEQRFKSELVERESVLSNLRGEENFVADMAALSTHLKDYYKFMSNKLIYTFENVFIEISRRTNIDVNLIKCLDDLEIAKLLKKEVLDFEVVKLRDHHNTMVALNGDFSTYIGEETEKFTKKYLVLDSTSSEYKGRVASKGYVKGRARIVKSSNDFHKIIDGDILIVGNTTPDYVPILRRVIGIVAEEGGITAHVSVISREFNIPAVVGIPRISEIIKDNDMVEVDADKGIVRIIK